MGPLVLAGLGIGAVSGAIANKQRIEDERKNKLLLEMERDRVAKRMYATSSILEGNMTIGAMQATQQSKASAVEAYKAESASEENLGKSGLSGGTAFYQHDKMALENERALFDQAALVAKQFDVEEMSGKMQIDDFRANIAIMNEKMKEVNDRLGYLSSPFAFIVSAATGALSGGVAGANIQKLGAELTGNPDWGEWPAPAFDASMPPIAPAAPGSKMPTVSPLQFGAPAAPGSAMPTVSPLQFGGMNMNNTAMIGAQTGGDAISSALRLSVASQARPPLSFDTDLNKAKNPFALFGGTSGFRFSQ